MHSIFDLYSAFIQKNSTTRIYNLKDIIPISMFNAHAIALTRAEMKDIGSDKALVQHADAV